MNQQLYQYLLGIAANGLYTRYSDAGLIVHLDMNEPADRDEISRLLDEISVHEHCAGHPLLSAVVIHTKDNMPGNGFFTMAQRVGRFNGGDRLHFWLNELKNVHSHWANQANE
ncbi:MAG: hypothetical protein KGZ88_22675 [Methylomicrobium sp.]|nr:hypothetical protein [Methylomicrobium sp.]